MGSITLYVLSDGVDGSRILALVMKSTGRMKMAKKDDTQDDKGAKAVPMCKRCGKPIVNPNGDNGCGAHTVGDKTVTNCVPKDAA